MTSQMKPGLPKRCKRCAGWHAPSCLCGRGLSCLCADDKRRPLHRAHHPVCFVFLINSIIHYVDLLAHQPLRPSLTDEKQSNCLADSLKLREDIKGTFLLHTGGTIAPTSPLPPSLDALQCTPPPACRHRRPARLAGWLWVKESGRRRRGAAGAAGVSRHRARATALPPCSTLLPLPCASSHPLPAPVATAARPGVAVGGGKWR